jgi:hypothetical protein
MKNLKDTLQTDITPDEEEIKRSAVPDTGGKAPVKKEKEKQTNDLA